MKSSPFTRKHSTFDVKKNSFKSIGKALFSRKKLAAAITAQVLLCSSSFAAPTGGIITGGEGTIEQVGAETTIDQGTDRLSIDWNSFDVGVNESVEFIQPTESSIALNNILGTNGSQILGQIDANGHVVLVNPNGIYFGQSATVNVGGLIASGLQINPDDFINGDLVFKGLEGTDGAVINSGLLNASLGGNVALLGKEVENRGLIMANMGRVNLVAGEQVVLTFDNQGMLGVQVNEALIKDELEGADGSEAVKNSGEIRAENGQILLSAAKAQDVFSQAVNRGARSAKSVVYHDDGSFTLGGGSDVINTGTIDAGGKNSAGDVVVLGENVTNEGAILANTQNGTAGNVELHSNTTTALQKNATVQANAERSGQGGEIKLQGTNIGLFNDSSVTARGVNGGGQILIGGDREGLNPRVRNSEFVYVGENASVSTSAIKDGNGGKLITFAEDTARIYGQLLSTGGNESGNGGFIETSGISGFEILQTPDISAVLGNGGHWLIDPYSITITGSDLNVTGDGSASSPFQPNNGNAFLEDSILEDALNNGGSVTVQTVEGGDTNGGNITVSTPISLADTEHSTLNLIAHNNISIDANITAGDKDSSRSLNIHLEANRSNSSAADDGNISIADGIEIDTNGGDFKIGQISGDFLTIDTTVAGANDVNFGNATIDLTDADYSGSLLDDYFPGRTDGPEGLAPSGSLAINALRDVELGTVTIKGRDVDASTYKIDVAAGGNITLAQGFTYDNNPTEDFEGSGSINNNSFSTLSLRAGDNITFEGDIERDFADDDRREHQDRLNIRLEANTNDNAVGSGLGDIIFGTSPGNIDVLTAGGDILILDAANVDWSGDTFDVSSAFGPGSISITALSNITTGTIKTDFDAVTGEVIDAETLRIMDVALVAGGTLTLNGNIATNSGSITLSGSNVDLDSYALSTLRTLVDDFPSSAGDVSVTTSSSLELNNVSSLGDVSLNVTNPVLDVDNPPAAVNISQSGSSSLVVGRALYVNAENANVLLTENNNIASLISANVSADDLVTGAGSFSLRNEAEDGIQIDSLDIAGDLFLNANSGNILNTDASTGAVLVGGATELRSDGNITLSHSGNVFSGAVYFDDSGDTLDAVTLVNDGALSIGRDDGADSELRGELNVTARGAISQVEGSSIEMPEDETTGASFTAESEDAATRFDIVLSEDNLFEVVNLVADNATISNDRSFYLNSIDVSSVLDITTTNGGGGSGSVRQTSNPNITVNELVLSVVGDVELGGSGNRNIQSVTGSAGSLTLHTASTLSISDLAIGGHSDVVSQGLIIAPDAIFSNVNPGVVDDVVSLEVDASSGAVNLSNDFGFQDGIDLAITNATSLNFNASVTQEGGTSSNLSVSGNFGENTFTVGNAAEHSINRVNFDGSSDDDVIVGPSNGASWEVPAADNPFVTVNGSDFYFTGFETVNAGNGVDAFTFNNDLTIQINANGGADVFTFGDNFNGVSIDGGVDADVDVLQGNDGTNDWSLTGSVINDDNTLTFANIDRLEGGSGTNNLTGPDANVTWSLGNGTGSVGGVSYFDMDTITGGSGNDRFELQADANVDYTLNGGGGSNTLVGRDENTAWNITGENTGSVASGLEYILANQYVDSFINIQNLEGRSGVDNFFFNSADAEITGQINGAGGADSINYSQRVDDLNIEMGFDSLANVVSVETIIGNNNDNSVLSILDGDSPSINDDTYSNVWTITDNNDGQVVLARGDLGDTTTITFEDFGSVAGGTVIDDFNFADVATAILTGRIDGDSTSAGITSVNTLNTPIADATWGINNGSVSLMNGAVIRVSESEDITFLQGSSAQDVFSFQTIENIRLDGSTGLDGGGLEIQDQITFASVIGGGTVTVGGSAGLSASGVELIIGNNGDMILEQGSSGAATWDIKSTNTGTLTIGGVATNFQDFAHLLGGAGADTFNFTNTGIESDIDGSGGNDTLTTAPSLAREWQLSGSSGTFSNVGESQSITFANIETLNGSDTDIDTVSLSAVVADVGLEFKAGTGAGDVVSYASVDPATAATVGLGVGGLSGFEQVTGNNGALTLQASAAESTTWDVTTPNSGTVEVDGSDPITFTNFANLLGGSDIDQFTLREDVSGSVDGAGGADVFDLNESFSGTLAGGGGGDVFNFNNTTTGLVSGGTGTDTFNFASSVAGTVSGDDGADTFNINAANVSANISGGSGDTLNAFAGVDHTWSIASANNVVLSDTGASNTIVTSNISTLNGSAGHVDTARFSNLIDTLGFTLDAGELDGVDDVVSFADVPSDDDSSDTVALSLAGLNNFEQIVGNNADLVLQSSASEDSVWNVNATNTGTVSVDGSSMAFQSFAHLASGGGNDSYTLSALVSSINAGGGADTLDTTAIGSALSIGLGSGSSATLNTQGFTDVNANGDQANRLTSENGASWVINADNAGITTISGVDTAFSGIAYLEGIGGNHDFTLNSGGQLVDPQTNASGSVTGGSGTNSLSVLSGIDNDWALSTAESGSVTNVDTALTFENIQSLIGDSAIDSLTALATANTWVLSSDFSGSLNGLNFSGFEVLNGGAAADTFDVQNGSQQGAINGAGGTDDITFDGYTALDVAIDATDESGDIKALNIETIVAANGSEYQLNGLATADNSWTITGDDAGTLNGIAFSGFNALLGGSAVDTFSYGGSSALTVNGAAGTNRADFSGVTGEDVAITVSGVNTATDGAGTILNVDNFVGNNSGAATENSRLSLSAGVSATWTIDNTNSGNITYDDGGERTITFSSFNQLLGGSGADTFGIGADVNGSNAQLQGRGGNDVFNLNNSLSAEVTAGAGNDTFNILAAGINARLSGDTGDDALNAFEGAANYWLVRDGLSQLGNTDIAVTTEVTTSSAGIVFDSFETLVGSNAQSDRFAFNQTVMTGDVNAGTADTVIDELNFAAVDGSTNLAVDLVGSALESFERVVGNDENSTLNGKDEAAIWQVTADNAGRVDYVDDFIEFAGFAKLAGGSAIDTFTLAALVDVIDGGGPEDNTVDFSAYTNDLTVSISDGEDADILLQNISGVAANAARRNELVSAADLNSWTISEANAGTLNADGVPIGFDGFSFLSGTEENIFSIQGDGLLSYGTDLSTLGGVFGGTGENNTLVVAVGDNSRWLVNATNSGFVEITTEGVTRRLNFENIKTLEGGSNADDFILQGSNAFIDAIDGGAGANSLTGRDVNNRWQVTGDNAGTVDELFVSDPQVAFTNIQKLVGGEQNDAFTLVDGVEIGLLDGGEGSNEVDLTSYSTPVNVFVGSDARGTAGLPGVTINNIQTLDASDQVGNALYGSNEQDNIWLVAPETNDDADEGRLNSELTYQNFSKLVGGELGDTFNLGANELNLSINGGEGNNLISVAGTGGGDNVWVFNNFDSGELNGATNFTRVKSLTGDTGVDVFDFSAVDADPTSAPAEGTLDGGEGDDRLLGYNTINSWVVSEHNRGLIISDATGAGVNFENVEYLTGGELEDSFSIYTEGYVDGIIDGAGASNTVFQSPRFDGREVIIIESPDQYVDDSINVMNISQLLGSGELVGLNKRNVWVFTGADKGIYLTTTLDDPLFAFDPEQWSFVYEEGSDFVYEQNLGEQYRGLGFNEVVSVTGGASEDNFVFLNNSSLSSVLLGGEGSDSLQLGYNNSAHTWSINAENAGAVDINPADADPITLTLFESIENLIGSDAVDLFRFEDLGSGASITPSVAGINGKGGADIIELLSSEAHEVNLGENFSSIQVLREAGNVAIAAAITNIETINTGAGDDLVQVMGMGDVATLNTGEGSDTLSSALWATEEVAINLGDNTLSANDQTLTYSSVESFAANVTTESQLIGLEQNATWTLRSDYTGDAVFVQAAGEDAESVTTYSFDGFQNLQGTAANDDFVLAGFEIGSIDGGAGSNTLQTGGLSNADYQWQVNANNAGVVEVTAEEATWGFEFDNVQQITAGASSDHFSFSGSASVSGLIDAGEGLDQLSYTESASAWQVNGNTVAAPSTFIVAGAETASARFANVEVFNAQGDASIQAANEVNTWTFNGEGSGLLASEGHTDIQFNNFNRFLGGTEADHFVVDAVDNLSTVRAWIDGGTGLSDTLLITDETPDRQVGLMAYNPDRTDIDLFVTGVELLESDGLNSLHGASGTGLEYLWVVDSIYQGAVTYDNGDAVEIAFEGFNKIFAGESNDRFRIDASHFMDFISGGAGTGQDSIDYSQVNSDQVIVVDNTDSNTGVVGIEGFIGNNDGSTESIYQSTLRVANQSDSDGELHDNAWRLTGINSGTFIQDGGKTITFEGFNHLLGGQGDDSFTIEQGGNITGSISGAGAVSVTGNDSLTLSSTDDFNLMLALGQVNASTVNDYLLLSNIDVLVGNGSNTRLTGAPVNARWNLNGVDAGFVRYSDSGITTVNFEQVANLSGGLLDDTFVLNAGDKLSGWLSGGDGSDSVELNFDNAPVSVAVADTAQQQFIENAALNIRNDVEIIEGESPLSNTPLYTVIGASSAENTWQIGGQNAGVVNGVQFTGFDSIMGNARADTIQVADGGSLTGVIDGAAGVNAVNAQAAQQDLKVAVGTDHTLVSPDLQLKNIQSVTANTAFTNTLAGANQDTTWTVSAANAGDLNGVLNFTGFANLIGGSAQDAFVFSESGALSGYIDGGANPAEARDSVDYSQLAGNVKVRLADRVDGLVVLSADAEDQTASVIGVEQIKGNATGLGDGRSKAQLIANDYSNVWSIEDIDGDESEFSDGLNDGRLNSGAADIIFIDFNTLTGGALVDTFNQLDGSVTGVVSGGSGNDVFNLASNQNASGEYAGDAGNDTFNYRVGLNVGSTDINLNGGAGNDSVFLSGGDSSLTAQYSPSVSNGESVGIASLSFQYNQGDTVVAQALRYEDFERVQQGATIARLQVDGSASNNDQFYLSDGAFAVNNHTRVSYGNSTAKLDINAGNTDVIHLEESISVLDSLTLKNARLAIENTDAVVETTTLIIDGVSLDAGADNSENTLALKTNITNLAVNNIDNNLELVQQSDQASPLVLQNINNVDGSLSIRQSSGDVEQAEGASLDVGGQLEIRVDNGTINAQNTENAISGSIALIAPNGDVSFYNRSDVLVSDVQARNLTLGSGGSLTADGSVIASGATELSAVGAIDMTSGDNAFNSLSITESDSVALDSDVAGLLDLVFINSSGSVNLSGDRILVSGPVSGRGVILNARDTFEMSEQADLNSLAGLSVNASQGLDISTEVHAVDDITFTSDNGAYQQSANVLSESGSIHLQVAEDVYMSEQSQLIAEANSVTIEGFDGVGAGTISLGKIVASKEDGVVRLEGEKVVDNQLSEPREEGERGHVNIVANELVTETKSGFGSSDAIETELSVVDIVNTELTFDAISLDNAGALDVRALKAGGNIELKNDQDVSVSPGSTNAFYDDDTSLVDLVDEFIRSVDGGHQEAQQLRADVGSSELSLTVTEGALRVKGIPDTENPHISAYSTNIKVAGDIGDPVDPQLVFYVPEDFSLTADKRWKQLLWGFGLGVPNNFTEDVLLVPTIQAGEQLIVVEDLDEVDPAIFTAVKNYYFNEISILLPRDQRYEDEDEEY